MTALRRQVRDANWVRQSFLTATDDLEDLDIRNRTFTTARFKFSDTTPGGSIAINPPPQFTRNADLKVPGIFDPNTRNLARSTGTKGMGRYYSEAIDDNSRIISMRMGVPQFNSLTTFFTGFYNSDAGSLARTGRGTGVIYNIAKAAGFVVPLLSPPIFLLNFFGNFGRYLAAKPSSKYYYLKPTMPLYWNAVQGMVNLIAVNKGIVPRIFDADTKNILDDRYAFTAADMQMFADLLPDIAMEGGGINVYALATRSQRLARRMYKKLEADYRNASETVDLSADINRIYEDGMRLDVAGTSNPSFQNYLSQWLSARPSQPKAAKTSSESGEAVPDISTESIPKPDDDVAGWQEFLEAELDDGSAFVAFRVDNSGPTNESFQNTVTESEIAGKFNNMSGDSRSTNFSFANGNLDDGVVGKTIGLALGVVKDAVAGFAAGVGMSGLAALGGAAFVDIPKHWQSSTANLPRMDYSFTLVSPYGNKMSQLFNLYIPLSMILAAALPLSTGKQSYTSPFLIELYDRGRAQTRLGMIDSLSISRGVGNMSFNNSGEAMSIRVNFSVVDLSSVMHMPIIQGFSLTNPLSSIFDDDNAFTDYMAVLGSLSLNEQVYAFDKLKLGLTRQMTNMRTWFSKAHTTNFIGDLWPARLVSIFYVGQVNR